MAKNSSIEWTHHTFNPWIGCQKVSPACDNCYAEAWDKRFKGNRWGAHANRTRTQTWREPVNLGDHIRYLHWVITGGENAINYRPVNPDWFRHLRDQCSAAGVPFLFKQWEGRSQKLIKQKGRELDGIEHNGYPISTQRNINAIS